MSEKHPQQNVKNTIGIPNSLRLYLPLGLLSKVVSERRPWTKPIQDVVRPVLTAEWY